MNFNEIIDQVIEHEGGYVNDPHDTGGETNYGIAKRWYPEVDIKNLNVDDAVNIYYNDYWKPSKAEHLPKEIRGTYFDMCVNMGQKRAVIVLQETINSIGSTRIAEDGLIGKVTIEHSHKVSKRRLQAFRCLFYGELVNQKPDQKRFYYGWFKRAISI